MLCLRKKGLFVQTEGEGTGPPWEERRTATLDVLTYLEEETERGKRFQCWGFSIFMENPMEGIAYWGVLQITHFSLFQKNLSRQSCTLWSNTDPPMADGSGSHSMLSLGGLQKGLLFLFFLFGAPGPGTTGGVSWVNIFLHPKNHPSATHTLC